MTKEKKDGYEKYVKEVKAMGETPRSRESFEMRCQDDDVVFFQDPDAPLKS